MLFPYPIKVRVGTVLLLVNPTVSDGFRIARGEIAGYLDVDLEVHSRYIPSLVEAIEEGADVATVRRIYAFQIRPITQGHFDDTSSIISQ